MAERYGISDVALAKTCRKLGVPLPPRGYWAKVKAGQAPKRTALPALRNGKPDRQVSERRTRPPQQPRPPELDGAVPVPVEGRIVVADALTDSPVIIGFVPIVPTKSSRPAAT